MSTYELWYWAKLIQVLDAAGYRIVKKPELLNVGRPGWQNRDHA